MKTYFFVLFLFIGYCTCARNDDDDETESREMKNGEDYIVYPCPSYEINCIRKFFSTHGKCRIPCGPFPDPITLDRLSYHMSTSNISSTVLNANITGLDGNVTSFYINKKTNKLVIGFEAKPLTISSREITFMYHPIGEEPILLTDYFIITYTSVKYTAAIPNIKDLQPNKADYYSFLADGDPKYSLGPGLSRSSNPVVRKAYCDLISKIPQNGKESLVIQSRNFMVFYIQNKICDFGLKIERYD